MSLSSEIFAFRALLAAWRTISVSMTRRLSKVSSRLVCESCRKKSRGASKVRASRSVTNVPPPCREATIPSVESARIASRRLGRLIENISTSSRSGGSLSPGRKLPVRTKSTNSSDHMLLEVLTLDLAGRRNRDRLRLCSLCHCQSLCEAAAWIIGARTVSPSQYRGRAKNGFYVSEYLGSALEFVQIFWGIAKELDGRTREVDPPQGKRFSSSRHRRINAIDPNQTSSTLACYPIFLAVLFGQIRANDCEWLKPEIRVRGGAS